MVRIHVGQLTDLKTIGEWSLRLLHKSAQCNAKVLGFGSKVATSSYHALGD